MTISKEFKLTARCFYCQQVIDYAQRFWSKVDKTNGPDACWPWLGSKNKLGYGHAHGQDVNGNKRMFLAHRVAFQLEYGSIPKTKHAGIVCHTCDTPACVNPKHLYLGTPADNVRDVQARNRGWWIVKPRDSRGENGSYHKLTTQQVLEIRARAAAKETQHVIAKAYGVSQSTVYKIIHRKAWTNI